MEYGESGESKHLKQKPQFSVIHPQIRPYVRNIISVYCTRNRPLSI